METKFIVLVVVLLVLVVFPLAFAVWWQMTHNKNTRETQRTISDPDLLRLIRNEPDQMVSPHILADKTDLSVNEARSRLSALMSYGILNRSLGGNRHYYALKEPLREDKKLSLSPDPFLTVEDLLTIFEAHNYRVSAQELIIVTGLPLGVLKREMKHFEQEGIVQSMRGYAPSGFVISRFFILQEPYRSNPDRFRAQAGKLDLEMREILRNDNLIV